MLVSIHTVTFGVVRSIGGKTFCTKGFAGYHRFGNMDFLRNKWQLWFNVLDVNRDGSLSHDDVDISKDTFATLHHLDGSAGEAMGAKIESWWKVNILRGQTNAISEQMFIEALEKEYSVDKTTYTSKLNTEFKDGFAIIDINNDGSISEEEFIVMFKALGHKDETMMRTIFKSMNPADGLVPVQSMADAWTDFITNEDSAKPCPIKSALEAEKR